MTGQRVLNVARIPIRRVAWLLVLAALAVPAVPTRAHPLSGTAVTLVPTKQQVIVTLRMDAEALIARLGLLPAGTQTALTTASAPTASRHAPPALAARIRAMRESLTSALHLSADETPVPLTVTTVDVDDLRDATVTVHAALPPDTRTVTWQMDLASGSYALSVQVPARQDDIQWVEGRAPSAPVTLGTATAPSLIAHGLWLGFTHIVPKGVDHILFVAGLALVSGRRRDLLALVTSFTLAHSLTLGLGLYGVVSLPSSVVEPLIAASVAYVGLENLGRPQTPRLRLSVVFLFGLLHGLGFAGVLRDLTSSRTALLATLASFNIGVELGQIVVIVLTLSVLRLASRLTWRGGWGMARLASAAVGLTGAFWTIERLAGR